MSNHEPLVIPNARKLARERAANLLAEVLALNTEFELIPPSYLDHIEATYSSLQRGIIKASLNK